MQNIFLVILITKTNILIYISYNKSVKIRSSFKFKMFVNNQFESREANHILVCKKRLNRFIVRLNLATVYIFL